MSTDGTRMARRKTTVLVGMSTTTAAAVLLFATSTVIAGCGVLGLAMVWLAVAARLASPRRWSPVEVEHGTGGRRG